MEQLLIWLENPLVIIALTLWSLAWKGFALWKASRRNSPAWFVVLLVVNTIGLLEILYIFVFSKMDIFVGRGVTSEEKKILEFLRENKKVTNNDVEKLLSVSDSSATGYLQKMEYKSLVKQVGETGRGVHYVRT